MGNYFLSRKQTKKYFDWTYLIKIWACHLPTKQHNSHFSFLRKNVYMNETKRSICIKLKRLIIFVECLLFKKCCSSVFISPSIYYILYIIVNKFVKSLNIILEIWILNYHIGISKRCNIVKKMFRHVLLFYIKLMILGHFIGYI